MGGCISSLSGNKAGRQKDEEGIVIENAGALTSSSSGQLRVFVPHGTSCTISTQTATQSQIQFIRIQADRAIPGQAAQSNQNPTGVVGELPVTAFESDASSTHLLNPSSLGETTQNHEPASNPLGQSSLRSVDGNGISTLSPQGQAVDASGPPPSAPQEMIDTSTSPVLLANSRVTGMQHDAIQTTLPQEGDPGAVSDDVPTETSNRAATPPLYPTIRSDDAGPTPAGLGTAPTASAEDFLSASFSSLALPGARTDRLSASPSSFGGASVLPSVEGLDFSPPSSFTTTSTRYTNRRTRQRFSDSPSPQVGSSAVRGTSALFNFRAPSPSRESTASLFPTPALSTTQSSPSPPPALPSAETVAPSLSNVPSEQREVSPTLALPISPPISPPPAQSRIATRPQTTQSLTFPLVNPPNCRTCRRAGTREITEQYNKNGNAGRPYYTCKNKDPACTASFKFIVFDDDVGIDVANPLCRCQTPKPARQNRVSIGFGGRKKWNTGTGFWTCSTAQCGFWSASEHGDNGGGSFLPHLLPPPSWT
ncbi:MAG: hypothetical protein M1814_000500 [Vezdaea aestivalis]|nr:MAG: hypothetical protein M1814_000500 [Vezdaea aestivalis]